MKTKAHQTTKNASKWYCDMDCIIESEECYSNCGKELKDCIHMSESKGIKDDPVCWKNHSECFSKCGVDNELYSSAYAQSQGYFI